MHSNPTSKVQTDASLLYRVSLTSDAGVDNAILSVPRADGLGPGPLAASEHQPSISEMGKSPGKSVMDFTNNTGAVSKT